MYPTDEQKHQMAVTAGCCRFIWNRVLAMNNEEYKRTGHAPFIMTYSNMLPIWKKDPETEWLKEADASALVQTIRHLDKAFKNYFRNAKHFGKPRFKKKTHQFHYRTQCKGTDGRIDNKTNTIKLPKLGRVAIDNHRPTEGIPISATIRKERNGDYYVVITCKEVEIKPLHKAKTSVGIDLGIHDLVITSKNDRYPNPKYITQYERRLAHAQRILSKKKKGSANYEKQRIKVARIQAHIANARNYTIHNMTTELVRNNNTICAETLRPKNMVKNHHLAKAVSDAAFGEIVRQLTYKCEWYGREFIQIDAFFPSSKTCSHCGHILDELKLSTRTWTCPECGTRHDRDHNAAKNILAEGLAQR